MMGTRGMRSKQGGQGVRDIGLYARYLLAAGAGAVLVYFLDPDRGNRRRKMARDRAAAAVRITARRLATRARYVTSTVQGLVQKVSHQALKEEALLDDATLAHKVETQLFRDPGIPKGKININAEDGVVVLRGEVSHPEDISSIEERVRHIPGVHGVENLLHLPNTPPPMS